MANLKRLVKVTQQTPLDPRSISLLYSSLPGTPPPLNWCHLSFLEIEFSHPLLFHLQKLTDSRRDPNPPTPKQKRGSKGLHASTESFVVTTLPNPLPKLKFYLPATNTQPISSLLVSSHAEHVSLASTFTYSFPLSLHTP